MNVSYNERPIGALSTRLRRCNKVGENRDRVSGPEGPDSSPDLCVMRLVMVGT